ncbi:MAG: DMT family transporter [Clostridia bacterium]|nr:DMT family transporter [Clostridia bacterium]
MTKQRKTFLLGGLLAFLGGLFWGGSGVFGQYLFAYKEVTSMFLIPIRLLLGGAIMLVFFFIKDGRKTMEIWKNKKDAWLLVAYGVFGLGMCQFTYFQTIEWSNAGTACVIQYLGPSIIVVWTCLSMRRKPKLTEVIAVLCATVGIYIIATHGNPQNLVLSPKALIMGLLSAVAVAMYTLLPVKLLKKYSAPIILAWGMLVGGIVLSLIFRPWNYGMIIDMPSIGSLTYLIIIGTIGSFTLYTQSVKLIGGVKASLFSCIEPVSATVLAVLFMGTAFAPLDIVGFIFVLSTIFISAI